MSLAQELLLLRYSTCTLQACHHHNSICSYHNVALQYASDTIQLLQRAMESSIQYTARSFDAMNMRGDLGFWRGEAGGRIKLEDTTNLEMVDPKAGAVWSLG